MTNKRTRRINAKYHKQAPRAKSAVTARVNFDGKTERHTDLNHEEFRTRVASCREAYENSGIIGNIIDLMVDFSVENLRFEHPSESTKNFMDNWAVFSDLRSVSEEIFKGIYRDGNVPVLRVRGTLEDSKIRELRKSMAADNPNLSISKSTFIPVRYTILDVLRIWRDGSEILDDVTYEYELTNTDIKNITTVKEKRDPSQLKKIAEVLGKNVDRAQSTGRVPIDPDRFNLLQYKKDSYKAWASPMLWRIIDDIKFKKLLRDMDISVVEDAINAIIIFKLGNTTEGLPPRKEDFESFCNLLSAPNKSKNLVWSDLISMESEYPPVQDVLGSEKYEQVDNDIRSGLGVPETLINGKPGNFSNSFMGIKTLIERLETARAIFLRWLKAEVKYISDQMGFRVIPKVSMENINLMDEQAKRQIAIEMYDRNLISGETMIHLFGENFDTEMIRLKREDEFREDLHDQEPLRFFKVGKFTPFIQSIIAPDETPDKQSPINQGGNGEDGGRKAGDKGSEQSGTPGQRETKPVGETAASILDSLYIKSAKSHLRKLNKSSTKDLTVSEMKSSARNVAKILPWAIKAGAITSDVVSKSYKSEITEFTKGLNRQIDKISSKDIAVTKNILVQLMNNNIDLID